MMKASKEDTMGFLIGIIVGIVGFRMVLRKRRRHFAWEAMGGHGGGHWHKRRMGHMGHAFAGSWLFEDRFSDKATQFLQLSPSQQTEFRQLAHEVGKEMRGKRGTLDGLKRALGDVFSEDDYDTEKVAEWITTQDQAYESMRDKFLDAVSRLHTILDPMQRRRLATMLSGRGAGFGYA
jgi:uncharacterized membrane protein